MYDAVATQQFYVESACAGTKLMTSIKAALKCIMCTRTVSGRERKSRDCLKRFIIRNRYDECDGVSASEMNENLNNASSFPHSLTIVRRGFWRFECSA